MTDTMEEDSDVDMKKPPPKEVPVVHDEGFFTHRNGDTYAGFFEAKKKDRSLKMFGSGVYKTVEGDAYIGGWEGDKFGNQVVSIAYKDGAKYEGLIKDWSYSGKGSYTYPDTSILSCDFIDNCPVGNLVLTDPNKHTWLSVAEHGFCWFEPVNHYYDMMESTREYGGMKKRRKAPKTEVKEPSSSPPESSPPSSKPTKSKK